MSMRHISSDHGSGRKLQSHCSSHLSDCFLLLTSCRLHLSDKDVTLRRLQRAVKFCGYIPRRLLDAIRSSNTLRTAESAARGAIETSDKIEKALDAAVGDVTVPHGAFTMYPGDENRKLVDCLVEPISGWVWGQILSTLESRSLENAYKFYLKIEGSRYAAPLRGRMWERVVLRYFHYTETLSFTIQSLENGNIKEWAPFKDMTTFDFGPPRRLADHLKKCIIDNKAGFFRPKSKIFKSFDAIFYEPGEPLSLAQITENYLHFEKLSGLQDLQRLLSRRDGVLKSVRPSVASPWILLFIVPQPMDSTFPKQKQKPDVRIWHRKTRQYVLGLDKAAVFLCKS
jgi:hypothetical protein